MQHFLARLMLLISVFFSFPLIYGPSASSSGLSSVSTEEVNFISLSYFTVATHNYILNNTYQINNFFSYQGGVGRLSWRALLAVTTLF